MGLTGELGERLSALGEADGSDGSLGRVVSSMVSWVEEHRAAGLVWFVSLLGVNESVEALRRETRLGHGARRSVPT